MQESSRKVRCGILENREPYVHRVCRKDFLGKFREKFPVKLFWEKLGEVDHRGIKNLREPNFAGGTEANR
jgi:hypothetical protein